LPLLRLLLLGSLIGILCSCVPPDRIDYSPDDSTPSGGDDDDSTPSGGDDDDSTPSGGDDDDSTPSGGGSSDLRLVDGDSSNEGRVEILYEGTWGTVCDDDWDVQDAAVVCTQLGLPSDFAEALTSATFGQGEDPIWLDNVACLGSEVRLDECPHNGWGEENCSHSEDAGVRCN
jgi:hypothetical protein